MHRNIYTRAARAIDRCDSLVRKDIFHASPDSSETMRALCTWSLCKRPKPHALMMSSFAFCKAASVEPIEASSSVNSTRDPVSSWDMKLSGSSKALATG